MVVSTGSYIVNDTMMKLATAGLPPYEVLFLRGAAATLWGIPLLFVLGYGKHIPLMVVAISAVIVVLAGAGIAHLVSERWVVPETRHLLLMGVAGLFLIFGHFFIFMAYRVGPTSVVAPFYYCFTVWAVISGLVVFRQLPNALAICGILLVVASGLTIVSLDERKRRLTVVA